MEFWRGARERGQTACVSLFGCSCDVSYGTTLCCVSFTVLGVELIVLCHLQYSLLSGLWKAATAKVQYQVLILGLDHAGKTVSAERISDSFMLVFVSHLNARNLFARHSRSRSNACFLAILVLSTRRESHQPWVSTVSAFFWLAPMRGASI